MNYEFSFIAFFQLRSEFRRNPSVIKGEVGAEALHVIFI